jgi:hypothetical protein
MTRKHQIKLIRLLAEYYNIKVHFVNALVGGPSGSHGFNYETKEDYISISYDKDMISAFFHELGHSFCYRNGLWPSYHNTNVKVIKGKPRYTKRWLRAKLKTAYRAEVWVDKWAKRELKKYLPKYKYDAGYLGKSWTKKWLKEYLTIRYQYLLSDKRLPEF